MVVWVVYAYDHSAYDGSIKGIAMITSQKMKVASRTIGTISYMRLCTASLCVLLSLYIGIILWSFDPHDPSLFFATSDIVPLHNWAGHYGAMVASLLVFLMGGASLLLLPFFAMMAFRMLTMRHTKDTDIIIGWFILMSSIAAMAQHGGADLMRDISPGGLLGIKINDYVFALFDAWSGQIFLAVMLVIGICMATRLACIHIGIYGVRMLRFITNWDRFIKPMLLLCGRSMHAAYRGAINSARRLWSLLNGSQVHSEREPIIVFEELVERTWLEQQEQDDQFWRAFGDDAAKPVEQAVRADEAPVEFADEEDEVVAEAAQPRAPQPSLLKKILYQLPNLSLFKPIDNRQVHQEQSRALKELARILEEKLERFGIHGTVQSIKIGPVITLFEYEPHIDTKISKIIALEDDLALALQAVSIRIIAPIPGRSVVGFEVANKVRRDVLLSTVLHSEEYTKTKANLPLILGEDVTGTTVIIDLAATPHLLVAGSTGSGKSVALNTMLVSLLCKYKPDELRMILIDPKRLEFACFADIAHLVFPIVTDPKKAAPVLKWVVQTMEERYALMEACNVRNVFDYHELCKRDASYVPMPWLVLVIDELADLMMTAGKEIEDLIARIAQMARAAGIHMIIATQRPSVDVITGLIKVNFPSRISFRVTSKVDSRTILDCVGAEKLLGKGDMLYLDSASHVRRVHGAYVSRSEVEQLITHIRNQQPASYVDLREALAYTSDASEPDDALYHDVLNYLQTVDEVSISLLQRRFKIGYNRSARIIEMLESQGMLIQDPSGKSRKVIR